ncbi:hypothetical protein [Brachybacterium sp. GPGPB12]|uniref:hypothetical protein n=1 Tax=Brachybacterium sp. GPGPB12 TaxID=3023517 RepID=UPI0031345437
MTTTETNHPGAEDPSSPPEPENRDGAAETPEGASRADERTVDLPASADFRSRRWIARSSWSRRRR